MHHCTVFCAPLSDTPLGGARRGRSLAREAFTQDVFSSWRRHDARHAWTRGQGPPALAAGHWRASSRVRGTAQGAVHPPIRGSTGRRCVPPATRSSRSVWDHHLLTAGRAERLTLNRFNHDTMADILLARAVGYAAGFLNTFLSFRFGAPAGPWWVTSSSLREGRDATGAGHRGEVASRGRPGQPTAQYPNGTPSVTSAATSPRGPPQDRDPRRPASASPRLWVPRTPRTDRPARP